MSQKRKRQTLRIIGGTLRGRSLPVVNAKDLRPTPDRIRETLFNWVQYDLVGKRCLDAFAGTGALGLEALSRGAAHVTFCEIHRQAMLQLTENIQTLGVNNATLLNNDGLATLKDGEAEAIFLDPPYALNLLPDAMKILANLPTTQQPQWLYLEHNQPLKDIVTPLLNTGFILHREKRAGQIHYGLLRKYPIR